MTATGHAILGTVIAAKIGNPALALPIAIASHFVADAFPHWDTATNIRRKGKKRVMIEAFLDVTMGFIISYLILQFLSPQTNYSYAILIVLAAQLPDWLTAPYYFFKIAFFKKAYTLQKIFDNKLNKPWDIINQIAVLALIVILVKIF